MPSAPTEASGSAATRTPSRRASTSQPASPSSHGTSFPAAVVTGAGVVAVAAAAVAAVDGEGSEGTVVAAAAADVHKTIRNEKGRVERAAASKIFSRLLLAVADA